MPSNWLSPLSPVLTHLLRPGSVLGQGDQPSGEDVVAAKFLEHLVKQYGVAIFLRAQPTEKERQL